MALLALMVALGACSSDFGISKDTMFGNPNIFVPAKDAPGGQASASVTADDFECPSVTVRTGAATLLIGGKPGEDEPSPLDVRYQGSIIRTARECHVNAGIMTMKVGIEGRVITGPAGGPSTVDVPLRIAVVHEGVNPKTVVSKFAHEVVSLNGAADRATFTHIDPAIAFPLPTPLGAIDSYVVYVGFDPLGATPEKKKPKAGHRAKPNPKPKLSTNPAQS